MFYSASLKKKCYSESVQHKCFTVHLFNRNGLQCISWTCMFNSASVQQKCFTVQCICSTKTFYSTVHFLNINVLQCISSIEMFNSSSVKQKCFTVYLFNITKRKAFYLSASDKTVTQNCKSDIWCGGEHSFGMFHHLPRYGTIFCWNAALSLSINSYLYIAKISGNLTLLSYSR